VGEAKRRTDLKVGHYREEGKRRRDMVVGQGGGRAIEFVVASL
jgi:hypothetical protein